MSTDDFNTPDPLNRHLGGMPPESGIDPDPTLGGTQRVPAEPEMVPGQPPFIFQDTPDSDDTGEQGKASQAADAAKGVAEEGGRAASHLADDVKQETRSVVEDVKGQASSLFGELGSDVQEQAGSQQQKIAANLRDISDEFRTMLDNSESSGTASSLVDQAAHHSGRFADWLEEREPGDVVDEVKSFARKRPAAFLGIAVAAGLLAGRITRNASGPKKDTEDKPERTQLPETAGPRSSALPDGSEVLPPTVNQTIGQGGVGGTGLNPGVYPPAAAPHPERGYETP